MAANIQLAEGASGKYAKTTEVSAGVHIGNTQLVNSSGTEIDPLTDTQLRASAVPVSAAALPLPSGASTEATLASVKTAVETIDNAISGSEMQVDVVAALPAGTAIIGAVKRDTINYTPIRKYYAYTGAVTDGIIWSPAAGKKWVVTDIKMVISAAATVTLEDDLSGGDAIVDAGDYAANGGFSSNLQTPWVSAEADADLMVTTTAGNVKIMVSGYEI